MLRLQSNKSMEGNIIRRMWISDILVSEDGEITIHSDFVQGEHENISTSFKRLFEASKSLLMTRKSANGFPKGRKRL